jgi:hypothetical protein
VETQTVDLKQSITKLLDAAKDTFVVEGDADGLWFVIEHAPYYRGHTKTYTDIMVKFLSDNMPVVLIPAKCKLGSGRTACEYFVQKNEFLRGWRAICPHAIAYTGEDTFELARRIVKLVGNPGLCDLTTCDKRSCPGWDSATLFDNEKTE